MVDQCLPLGGDRLLRAHVLGRVLMSAPTDNPRIGTIILVVPRMQLIEVVAWSTLLDLAVGESLDMEGGRTGRHGTFRPSRVSQS